MKSLLKLIRRWIIGGISKEEVIVFIKGLNWEDVESIKVDSEGVEVIQCYDNIKWKK